MTEPPRTAHVGDPRVLELRRCKLVILSGDDRGREQIIEGDLFRIGKSRDNQLVLPDETVSRSHCEIVRERRGYLLRDLGSTNGTLLDGAEIKEAWLKSGAVITVGKVELKVRPYSERIEILPSDATSFGDVVGRSVSMRSVFGLLERLGPTDATVLIGGETGTGKDVLARAIHATGPRARHPFIVVDCGAVVGSLIESELFGHEKGAFTGAAASRQGAFELAHKGTLFLDEIGELPLDLQPKLLRAIETRQIRRVGGNHSRSIDIRIIAASKRNLKMEVERGKFREDLYFRIAVVPVELPPLRERRKDIPVLVVTLLANLAAADPSGSTPTRVSDETMSALEAHDWPGNVRELRNVLERASYLCRAAGHDEMHIGMVPFAGGMATRETRIPEGDPPPAFEKGRSYRDTKAEWEARFERRYVTWLLEQSDGNISAAARAADMDRKYLHKLVRKHGWSPKDQD